MPRPPLPLPPVVTEQESLNMPAEGAVAFGLLPVILFGGVIGASMGMGVIYAGAIEEGAENIFAEAAPAVAAHSPKEALKATAPQPSFAAASVFEHRSFGKGFAAMFQ